MALLLVQPFIYIVYRQFYKLSTNIYYTNHYFLYTALGSFHVFAIYFQYLFMAKWSVFQYGCTACLNDGVECEVPSRLFSRQWEALPIVDVALLSLPQWATIYLATISQRRGGNAMYTFKTHRKKSLLVQFSQVSNLTLIIIVDHLQHSSSLRNGTLLLPHKGPCKRCYMN